MFSSKIIPCYNPDCENGTIYVHDAYSSNPLKPKEYVCDTCDGHGFLVISDEFALTN